MEAIDFNSIAQLAPAVFVMAWIIYRQEMRIDRLEKSCIEIHQKIVQSEHLFEGEDRSQPDQ